MKLQTRQFLLAGTIVLSLLSLPMTWMTIHNAELTGGFGPFMPPGGLNLDVTGLNGHVNFLVKTPLWFVVCVVIAAAVLELLHYTRRASIPRVAAWTAAVAGAAWVGITLLIVIGSADASLGLGAILAAVSAAMPILSLIQPAPVAADGNFNSE